MNIDLIGKSAFVSGGAKGLGKSFVNALARSGATVYFTSRDSDSIARLETESTKHGLKVKGINVDITESDSLNKVGLILNAEKINIDILINNVGDTLGIGAFDEDISNWEKVMNLNFYTHVRLTNYFLKDMKIKQWGRIVNITSIAGLEVSGPPAFNASKATLTAYTRSVGRLLAIEDPGIVMTAVAPGIVATSGGHWEKIEKSDPVHLKNYMENRAALKRFGNEDEISGIVTFLCSEYSSFFHGSIIQVDGGQSRSYMSHTYLD